MLAPTTYHEYGAGRVGDAVDVGEHVVGQRVAEVEGHAEYGQQRRLRE
jgi:hypothetical protein